MRNYKELVYKVLATVSLVLFIVIYLALVVFPYYKGRSSHVMGVRNRDNFVLWIPMLLLLLIKFIWQQNTHDDD